MEKAELVNLILSKGLEEKPTEFTFLSDFNQVQATTVFIFGNWRLYKYLGKACKKLVKQYLAKLKRFQPSTEELSSLAILLACRDFYFKEVETGITMIHEFRKYLNDGHWLSSLLGMPRDLEDNFKDYRKEK